MAHKASNNESTPSQSDMSDETEEVYVKDESGRWVSKSKLASIKRLEEINRELYRDDQPNQSADNTWSVTFENYCWSNLFQKDGNDITQNHQKLL